MSASLRAFYPTAEEGEEARARVAASVPLLDALIVDREGLAGLARFGLDAEARAHAAAQLANGGVLLVLVVAEREDLHAVRAALDAFADERAPAPAPVAEQLRTAEPLLVRAKARIEADLAAPAAAEAPAPAFIAADALAASGLFAGRTLDFAETREEAVVARVPFVREELVIRKSVEERTQRVAGTVRSTEAEVEALGPRPSRASFVVLDQPQPV